VDTVIALGFLLGMQHAMEADHIAAVAAITHSNSSRKTALIQGCTWALGHSFALLVLVLIVLGSGFSISDAMSHWMEFAVGVMLIVLGLRAILTAKQKRMHIHAHQHVNGRKHIHAHCHSADAPTDHNTQTHTAPKNVKLPLLVGLLHGVAGSAALIIFLAATSLSSLWQAVGYVMYFGAGSILGMGAMSLTFTVPVCWLQNRAPWGKTTLSIGIGFGALGIGIHRCLISVPI
tara:strand:- start:335 stop:1033 length:699 start_codon:yes stop_codon:yes gene_type:complete